MRTKGKITKWVENKGYGFISPLAGGKQIFIHSKAFRNSKRTPEKDQMVTYVVSSDKQGRPCAVKASMTNDKLQHNEKKNNGVISILFVIMFIGIVVISVFAGKLSPIIPAIYIGFSILTYFIYAIDKSAAKKGTWRIQERTLHLFSLTGGWPGALVAQQTLRHKTRKTSFRVVFWITVLLNLGVFIWLYSTNGSTILHSLIQRMA